MPSCCLFVLSFPPPDKVNLFPVRGKGNCMTEYNICNGIKKNIPYYLNEVTAPNVLWYMTSVVSHSYSMLLFRIKEPVQEEVRTINAF